MSEELKPCPFCGGEAEIWRAHPENPPRKAWIACMSRCAVMTKEHDTDAAAIAAWNTRASEPEMAEALEGLLDAIAVHVSSEGRRSWALKVNTPVAYDAARAALAKARGDQ